MTRTLIARSRWALPAALIALVAVLLLTHASGAPAASGTKVTATLSDFKIKLSKSSAPAGRVTFVVKNAAKDMSHEMVVIKTSKKAAKLTVNGKSASEKGSVGEVSDIGGGKSKTKTFTLKKGHYALICNIPGHYAAGMHVDFTVS